MWFEEVEEIFRYYIPYYLLIVLPIFIIVCPSNPVLAAHEFPVYRMQQYDLRGIAHGCRSAALNLEARPVNGWSNQRHCIVAKWKDMTIDQFIHLRSKAGAFLIMLPRDVTALSAEEKEVCLKKFVGELKECTICPKINVHRNTTQVKL